MMYNTNRGLFGFINGILLWMGIVLTISGEGNIAYATLGLFILITYSVINNLNWEEKK